MDGAGFSVRDGRLYAEELACTELAARFGTPLYVVSETRLRSNVRRLGVALAAGWPFGEARLLPSIKANPTLATRAVLTSEGAGCDTFGETEFEAALRAGVPPALISVNGASKSAALIRRAVAAGAGRPRGAVGLRERRDLDPRGVSVLQGRRPHRRRRGAGACRAGFAARRTCWGARPLGAPDRGRRP